MQTNLQIRKIMSRFEELKKIDEDHHEMETSKTLLLDIVGEFMKNKKHQSKAEKDQQQAEQDKNKETLFTKTTIARQVAKLKPYLAIQKINPTTEERQEHKNQQYNTENYKMLSNLIILQNRKLCKILQENQKFESKSQRLERAQKEKEGWIFQVFYRSIRDQSQDMTKKGFSCVYAVFTQILEIFPSLTFSKKMMTIYVNEIKHVKYTEDVHYEIIQITMNSDIVVQIGFLNNEQFNLFDRLLFLQKNMAKSTSTRLFQNQLIKNIYAQF